MRLYVFRHGIAEEAAASLHDFDRTLTVKGRKRIREVAKVLAKHDEVPEVIISSPLVRAVQTAEIIASVLEPEQAVGVRQELAPGGDGIGLVRELVTCGLEAVMLVGHEPGLSELTLGLLGGSGWDKGYQKSMVAGFKVDPSGIVKTRFILDPKDLRLQLLR